MKGTVTISLNDYEELKQNADKSEIYFDALGYVRTKIDMLYYDIPIKDLSKIEIKAELIKIFSVVEEARNNELK